MRFSGLTPSQDRALHEFKQGRPVILTTDAQTLLCWAIDPSRSIDLTDGGYVILSAQRAKAVGLAESPVALQVDPVGGPTQLQFLTSSRTQVDLRPCESPDFTQSLIELAKQGRVMPAFYLRPLGTYAEGGLVKVSAADLSETAPLPPLERVSTVPLPISLHGKTIQTQALLFEGGPLHEEMVVLHIGDPHEVTAPLVRLHSACLTGDVFGSLRCDCGPQLHQALETMAEETVGCLLYLPQEGRDTGLFNKLRAYALQDAGLDTIDADATLGFEPDERDFALAATLLKKQGLTHIRLMTNNPAKVAGLEAEGIEVVERVPLKITPHEHNEAYLDTKAQRAGHYL